MRFAPLALAAAAILVLFTGLDAVGLIDVREARDAQVARELVGGAGTLTPLYAGEPLFEKPLLAYAPEVAARFLGGDFDTRSRQIRAVLAALLVVLTASVGAQHFGARAGWASGLVLATMMGLPLAARTDGTQLLGTLGGWIGCAALADALFGRRAGRDFRLLVGWGALAAALIVAGPLPALWPLLALALYLRLAREAGAWRRLRPWLGIALLAALALPWYGAMVGRHGAEFAGHAAVFPYALGERVAWYAGPVFALSFLMLGGFPWSALLPAAIHHAAAWWFAPRRAVDAAPGAEVLSDALTRGRHEEGVAHFFVACLVAALLPVVIYPGPPLPAALPALPAAALLLGRFLDHLLETPGVLAGAFTRGALMAALFGTALAVVAATAATRMGDSAPAVRLVATVVFVTSWLPFLAGLMRRTRLAAGLLLLPVALGTPVVAARLLPGLDGFLGASPVAAAMNAASPPAAALVVAGPAPPSLRLYLRRHLVVADSLAAALERHRAADGLAYVAFRPRREAEVAGAAGGPIEIMLRTSSLVLARVHPER